MPARVLVVVLAAAALAAGGCARVPEEAAGTLVRRKLTVQFSVLGKVNPLYYYFIAINAANDSTAGPVPVVAAPWGNGWVTGEATHYIQFHLGSFGVFKFRPDSELLSADLLGTPFEFNQPDQAPGNVIRTTLDVDAMLGEDVHLITMNLITTNRINVEPTSDELKPFDALGASGNDFVAIPLDITQTFTNSSLTAEGAGDVLQLADVQTNDLDITDWQAVVQVNQ